MGLTKQAGSRDIVALRLDDVGASTKRYEVYSNHSWRLGRVRFSGNWLFLKYLPPFKRWGPYREMTAKEWLKIFDILQRYDARLTVGVTAAWARSENEWVPFPEKFPEEGAVLKDGVERGLIEIANHGLTHCVLEGNAFKPKLLSGNRRYHREFWDWVPAEVQEDHVLRSQEILQTFFQTEVVTFVPPGNVFTDATVEIAQRHGLRYISCRTPRRAHGDVAIIGDEQVLAFHDRDIVFKGVEWLRRLIVDQEGKRFSLVRELGKEVPASGEPRAVPGR